MVTISSSDRQARATKPMDIEVLSIQSQVAYGRVGNNIAIPALHAMGLEVAAVPTVLLSNNPGYPSCHGGAVPLPWFEGFLQDLVARGALDRLKAILTGYLGTPLQAEAISAWAERKRSRLNRPLIVVDPVLGDFDTGLYADPDLLRAYRRHLLFSATGLTPNHFELELIVGCQIDDADDVIRAARHLLGGNTEWVVVTSAAPRSCPPEQLQMIVVNSQGCETVVHPRIPTSLKGTGDLFSALLTAGILGGASVFESTEWAAGEVIRCLEHTHLMGCEEILLAPTISPQPQTALRTETSPTNQCPTL